MEVQAEGVPASLAMVLVAACADRAMSRSRQATLAVSRPYGSWPHWEASAGGLVVVESLVVHRMLVLPLVVVCAVLRLGQPQAAPRQHCCQGDHHRERLHRPAVGLGRYPRYPSPVALQVGLGL